MIIMFKVLKVFVCIIWRMSWNIHTAKQYVSWKFHLSLYIQALQDLKDSVAEKESRLTSVTLQLEDTESQLQRTRQDLYIEQEHTSELEAEVRTRQDLYIEQKHTSELESHFAKALCKNILI